MADCVFCRIVAGELPAHRIHEDDDVIAIMDAGHVNPGHTLVIVKRHAETLMDLDEALAGRAFAAACRIARALDRHYRPGGITVLQANRPAGMQTVPHFHLHVLPRHEGDGVELTWPAKYPAGDELARHAAEIRQVLGGA